MQQASNSAEVVHWEQLQGNKMSKALHPAMLSEDGYVTTGKFPIIGLPKSDTRYVTLHYDRKYVICWLVSKLIKPFQNQGLDKILEMVKEAWELLHTPQQRYTQPAIAYDEERE